MTRWSCEVIINVPLPFGSAVHYNSANSHESWEHPWVSSVSIASAYILVFITSRSKWKLVSQQTVYVSSFSLHFPWYQPTSDAFLLALKEGIHSNTHCWWWIFVSVSCHCRWANKHLHSNHTYHLLEVFCLKCILSKQRRVDGDINSFWLVLSYTVYSR